MRHLFLPLLATVTLSACYPSITKDVIFQVTGKTPSLAAREFEGNLCGEIVYETTTDSKKVDNHIQHFCEKVSLENQSFKAEVTAKLSAGKSDSIKLKNVQNITLDTHFEIPADKTAQFSEQANQYKGVISGFELVNESIIKGELTFTLEKTEMQYGYEAIAKACMQLSNPTNRSFCTEHKIPPSIARACTNSWQTNDEYSCLYNYIYHYK